MFIPTSTTEEKAKRRVLSYSLSREIPHEDFFDGNIIYTDGSLGRVYKISPLFIDSLDERSQEIFGASLAASVSALPPGSKLQFLWRKESETPILKKHLDIAKRDDPILGLLAEDRVSMFDKMRVNGELFSVSGEIWIRRKYPRNTPGTLSAITEINSAKAIEKFYAEHKSISSDFSILCDSVVSPVAKYLSPVQGDAASVVSSLWKYFVGDDNIPEWRFEKPIRTLFGGIDVSRKWGYLAVGNQNERLVAVMSVDDIPSYSFTSMINHLLFTPLEMTVTMNVEAIPIDRVKEDLRRLYRRYTSGIISGDPEMEERATEVDALLRELERTSGQMVETEMYITLTAKTVQELSHKISVVSSTLRSKMDMVVKQEKAALHLAWRAAMPGWCSTGTVDRNFKIMTRNAADIAPVLGPPESSRTPLFLMKAPYGTVHGLDIFDSRLPAGHGLVVGSTGSGKSFTMSLLLLSSMARDPLIFIIDRGGSYRKLCDMIGGAYVDLSGDVAFNPLEGKDVWRDRAGVVSLMLQSMVSDDGKISREEKVIIDRLVQEIYLSFERQNITREPTLSDAYRILRVQRLFDPETEDLETVQRQVTLHLARWTRVGSKGTTFYSKMLDNPKTTVTAEGSDFIVFDLQGAEQYPEVLRVIFLYLTDIVQRRIVREKQRQKILVFDEAWAILNDEDSANFLAELYRTMRKFDCAVFAITQDITDLADSPISAAVISNTYRHIILRQVNDRAISSLEKVLNLNEMERIIISLLDQKKGYYSEVFLKQQGIGSSKMSVVPSPVEYWMATTDPRDNKELTEILKKMALEDALKDLAEKYPHGISAR